MPRPTGGPDEPAGFLRSGSMIFPKKIALNVLSSNTVFTTDVTLSVKPAQLVALEKSIGSVKGQISAAHGFGKLVAETELAFLELLKTVISVFEHPSSQALETDKLILNVN